ncbi:MAG TPA: LPS export ABC transporter periplasmic protein LptC, partial [Desulfobacterales bacterium]|nr:LPS export ABC transporter periplasmic protein LptC [Desulfobacterales bacterium]
KRYVEHYSKISVCLGNTVFVLCSLKKSKVLHSSRIIKAVLGLSLVLFNLVSVLGTASAKDPSNPFQDDAKVPWHIVADEINYDDQAKVYIGKGNVVITKKDKNLNADYVRFNQNTMDVFAEGHVVMTVGKSIITGNSMKMNLESETGTIYNGTIFIDENHFYITGDKIQKVGKDSYAADKASISTCDGDSPAWKITGRNLKVTVEGYGFVKHAALWAKKVPVLYTPFLVFPVKLKRQTGLLAPQFGYSDRKGGEYIQPFFWAINESSDATFYSHYMGFRGEKLGLEYRYVLDEQSKGTLMGDFLDDRQVDDGSPDSEKWGYPGDSALRPNSDRYWFRMKHDQALPHGFFARLDVDWVSDQDYLHEFLDGYTGFNETERYYLEEFGRGFDAYDDPVRLNRFNVNKNWFLYSLNAELRWYDDVIKRRQEETDTTLQRLPVITFNGSKQSISTSPFYFDLGSEYTYFYSEDGPRNHRADVHPRFYLPYSYKSYFTIEPSVGFRETVWYIDKKGYQTSDKKTLTRELYDLQVDLSSEVFHVFNLEGENIKRIKHAIRPQITYNYTPEKDQSDLPALDNIDRIARVNLITYSLTNTLTSKSKRDAGRMKEHPSEKSEGDSSLQPPIYGYNEFLRFKLEQSYDINKEKEDDPEPFSPIHGELELYPKRYFSVRADADWSHYDGNFRSRNLTASFWDMRGDKLSVDYRYQKDKSETIYSNLELKVSERLSIYGEHERNIFDSKDLKYGLGFLYETQ